MTVLAATAQVLDRALGGWAFSGELSLKGEVLPTPACLWPSRPRVPGSSESWCRRRTRSAPRTTAGASPGDGRRSSLRWTCPTVHDGTMEGPEVLYAWNGDIALAYRITGSGPIDLLHLPGYTSNVELDWESPYQARFLRRLDSFSEAPSTMDRRGWGCSDRLSPGAYPPLESPGRRSRGSDGSGVVEASTRSSRAAATTACSRCCSQLLILIACPP